MMAKKSSKLNEIPLTKDDMKMASNGAPKLSKQPKPPMSVEEATLRKKLLGLSKHDLVDCLMLYAAKSASKVKLIECHREFKRHFKSLKPEHRSPHQKRSRERKADALRSEERSAKRSRVAIREKEEEKQRKEQENIMQKYMKMPEDEFLQEIEKMSQAAVEAGVWAPGQVGTPREKYPPLSPASMIGSETRRLAAAAARGRDGPATPSAKTALLAELSAVPLTGPRTRKRARAADDAEQVEGVSA